MPADMYKVTKAKEGMITFLQAQGPNIPVHIAREVALSPMFASAFLSELYREQKVKMSTMKVGSSPIYYLTGQENQLENFMQYLNQREREALLLIKQTGIIDDDAAEPVMRVALRSIKDFAVPIDVNHHSVSKIFWKYHLLSDQEARTRIEQSLLNPTGNKIQVQQAPQTQPLQQIEQHIQPTINEISIEPIEQAIEKIEKPKKPAKQKQSIQAKEISFSLIPQQQNIQAIPETQLSKTLRTYCSKQNLEIIQIELSKKKEVEATLSMQTPFGKQAYYCLVKDKKKLGEADIAVALQKAQEQRMPVLILLPGQPDKKARVLLQQWGNLVRVCKLD